MYRYFYAKYLEKVAQKIFKSSHPFNFLDVGDLFFLLRRGFLLKTDEIFVAWAGPIFLLSS